MKITLHVSFYRHNTAGVQKKLSKLLSLLVILLGWAISGSVRIILICNDVCESAQMGIRNRTSVALTSHALEMPLHHLVKTATHIPTEILATSSV